jgi:hypothetical protein
MWDLNKQQARRKEAGEIEVRHITNTAWQFLKDINYRLLQTVESSCMREVSARMSGILAKIFGAFDQLFQVNT